jgi:hypothetical protein
VPGFFCVLSEILAFFPIAAVAGTRKLRPRLAWVARNDDRVSVMTKVAYEVTPKGDQWQVTCDGQPGMSYVSQEAAFEVAVAEASGALRTGHEIHIEVVGNAYSRTGDGSRPAAGTT